MIAEQVLKVDRVLLSTSKIWWLYIPSKKCRLGNKIGSGALLGSDINLQNRVVESTMYLIKKKLYGMLNSFW